METYELNCWWSHCINGGYIYEETFTIDAQSLAGAVALVIGRIKHRTGAEVLQFKFYARIYQTANLTI